MVARRQEQITCYAEVAGLGPYKKRLVRCRERRKYLTWNFKTSSYIWLCANCYLNNNGAIWPLPIGIKRHDSRTRIAA